MRPTALLVAILVASLSGCASLKDHTFVAGPTLGRDADGLPSGMVLGGGFVGLRGPHLGVEAGVEAGRQTAHIVPILPGPTVQQTTALQVYANATYAIHPLRDSRARLYLLAGARHYRSSEIYTDAEDYGYTRDAYAWDAHDLALNAGLGVGYGPVSVEGLARFSLRGHEARDFPDHAVRLRVAIPLVRLGGR